MTDDRRRIVAEALVAVGPDRAAQLLGPFDEDELVEIAAEIARIGPLEPEQAAAALRHMAAGLVRPMAKSGGPEYAREVLTRVVEPSRLDAVIQRTAPDARPFGFLEVGNAEVIARALGGEPAGVAALALAHCVPSTAANILKLLPEEAQTELTIRMATIAPVSKDVSDLVEANLRRRIGPLATPVGIEEIEGMHVVVDMLGQSSKKIEKRVLESIRERDEELASQIREALFVFDDIGILDNRSIQEVLKSVDSSDLSMALKNANQTIQSRFLDNLSERARENLVEEMDYLASVPPAEARAAQKRIVATVRELEETGAIVIDRGGEDGDDDE